MTALPLRNGPITFEGALGLETLADGVRPWRLPPELRHLIAEPLAGTSQIPSGVRLTTETDTTRLLIDLTNEAGETAAIDLVVDGRLVETFRLPTPGRYQHAFDLPAGEKRLELYLPTYGKTTIHDVSVDPGATARAWQDPRPRWVTYGSSITACRRAHSPARAWPAMVAGSFDWHHTNLGFAGQCMFDPIVARVMARQPADYLSICLGINTYGGAFNPRTWLAAVTGFILTLRDGHPATPLLVISPIHSPPRETTPGPTGLTLVDMRQWLAELVAKLQANGDRHIQYVDGLDIISPADAACMPDELHPDADGIERMGRRVTEILRRVWAL